MRKHSARLFCGCFFPTLENTKLSLWITLYLVQDVVTLTVPILYVNFCNKGMNMEGGYWRYSISWVSWSLYWVLLIFNIFVVQSDDLGGEMKPLFKLYPSCHFLLLTVMLTQISHLTRYLEMGRIQCSTVDY